MHQARTQRNRSITRQELFSMQWDLTHFIAMAPLCCPRKNPLTRRTYVYQLNPISLRILMAIINGTGIWMARNHCVEKRLTFALQYPKGIFRNNTMMVMIISISIASVPVTAFWVTSNIANPVLIFLLFFLLAPLLKGFFLVQKGLPVGFFILSG